MALCRALNVKRSDCPMSRVILTCYGGILLVRCDIMYLDLELSLLESGIVEFMQEQEEENKYLREEITQLAYTNEKITQSMSFMTEQFAKVFETLKFLTQHRGQVQRPTQAPRAMSAPPTQQNVTESN